VESDWLNMEKSSFESTQELFFNLWLKTYETTMGRLVEMPAMGPAREKSEKLMKGFSTSVNLYATGMDSTANFQSVFIKQSAGYMKKWDARLKRKSVLRDIKIFIGSGLRHIVRPSRNS